MAVETVKWDDQNGDPFDVVEVTADDTLRVDLVGRDVHTGDLLIDSGSESVGYWSFDENLYRGFGCKPAPEPTPEPSEPAPEPSSDPAPEPSSDPAPQPDPTTPADDQSADVTPAHAADDADGSPAAGPTDTAAADQSPTGTGPTAGE